MDYIKNPKKIEEESFRIIESEMGQHSFTERELKIVKRVIHTTADFEYKDLLYIREGAIDAALSLFEKGGITIYADTNMITAGISKKVLEALNCKVVSYVRDEEIAKIAKEKGITRSMAGIEKAASEGVEIFLFGNAPTALYKLKELIEEGKACPKFVVAAPVGFVGAAQSKEDFEKIDIPMITVRGRKGGSTVTTAIVNALLYML
ncbi:precorrin-8X methylmutase [Clostridium felsineum]|uniref:Cobalt-precorrin-8 methylmutase n=1 Tax=Clostridium felsineum TaxID=36839 RepID=A0A1S8LQU7_9CLOT|nr:precorrin-8X methylmutase [Clostridium felsineum]MCR3757696.1 precorrin-8X methylmutase [Clostridium felsineum]URZ01059.1 Cobalt-precorrin-8 methylmutase [Clostridium felsineum]URZ06191.1 Cobalt-precorrin-8 methylmutase [Clostridium felsineum]URZ11226.1 Cobalt-precorrin-8 methylmutase [Clostridium felsineum]